MRKLATSWRRKLTSSAVLQNTWHLARALSNEWRWRVVTQREYNKCFASRIDPWNYDGTAFTLEKFQTAIDLLNNIRNGARFKRAWEIGCAEGAMTLYLAPICLQLLAVDFIPLALERATIRCRSCSNISFAKWDLKTDPVPGSFDLIIITDVLGTFGRHRDILRARDKIVSALAADGYLLYGDFLGEAANRRIQESKPGRMLLLRPRRIFELVAAHPELTKIALRETSMHLLTLSRKRRGD